VRVATRKRSSNLRAKQVFFFLSAYSLHSLILPQKKKDTIIATKMNKLLLHLCVRIWLKMICRTSYKWKLASPRCLSPKSTHKTSMIKYIVAHCPTIWSWASTSNCLIIVFAFCVFLFFCLQNSQRKLLVHVIARIRIFHLKIAILTLYRWQQTTPLSL
jgi:hypothetical protein